MKAAKFQRASVWILLACVAALSACSKFQQTASQAPDSAAAEPSSGAPSASLELAYDKPAVVGASVHATAAGLPPGKSVELTWGTVEGGWVVEDYYHFRGKKYSETTSKLGEFSSDSSGRLEATFRIPEDYGGVHEVIARVEGKAVAQNGIDVTQSFELEPRSGPVGTPVELRVKGFGWRTMESTWVVSWDNNNVGFVSAASTRGSATARFRAAGPAGDHIIKIYTGWQGQSYLNYEQSPVARMPRPQFTFRTTAAAGPGGGASATRAAYEEPYPKQPVKPAEVKLAGATLAVGPTQGPVGTRVMLHGEGFPRNTPLKLVWETFEGSRVSGLGFEPDEKALGQVQVGSDGKFSLPMTIPEDLGGMHGLVLRNGDKELARAFFAIETSIVSITPTSGPVGTPVTIHLKGVGWTEYDNIYAADYDNAYMGYACGFNSQGDVVINFTASGAPGVHLIDLYPGIYEGPASEPQQLYRLPQLTYADDHPGNKIPALRFAFEVTPGRRAPALATPAAPAAKSPDRS